jgi:ubiquinone/menaquinone biosynthesis C-methylase UbiE
MEPLDQFAGGDASYLRDVQYGDSNKLKARADLHIKWGTAATPWFDWVGQQVDWPPGARVLEVGCGPGWLWEEAAVLPRHDVRATLVDLSHGMVGEALGRAREAGVSAAAGLVADAAQLPLAVAEFEVAIANHMLYHLADPAAGVAELRRVLRPGGVLVAATIGPAHCQELWQLLAEVFGISPLARMAEKFGAVTGEPILRGQFDDVEWRAYETDLVCRDPADVVAYLTSMPPGEGAAADQRAALERATAAAFERGNGVFRISGDSGAFVCRG